MRSNHRGQVIVVIAILLMVVLLFLAVIVDGARLMVEKQELERVADGAARAGLVLVGDQMVTQVIYAQTMAALHTGTPTPMGGLPHPTSTPTPLPHDFYAWVNDDARATLASPAMQTAVAGQVQSYAENNGLGLSNPDVLEVQVVYPYEYHPDDPDLEIYVLIRRRVATLLVGLLGVEQSELIGDTKQSIPQRR